MALSVVTYITMTASLACFTVIGNILTIIAFCWRPVLRKNPSYWYITSLAVADFLVGVVGVPSTMYDELSVTRPSHQDCDIILFLHLLSVVPTFSHLLTISTDRYYKLQHPFKYLKIMSVRKAFLIIAFLWISSLITILLFLIPKHSFGATCVVITFPGTVTTRFSEPPN